jgi:glycosyltransferase involved in cell wall biosynthesis
MKIACLFNRPMTPTVAAARAGGPQHQLFGMLALEQFGHQVTHLEIEHYMPSRVAAWLRRHLLTMHVAHLPLFPLFFRYDVILTSTAYTSLLLKALITVTFPFFRRHLFKWILIDFNILGTLGAGTTIRQRVFAFALRHGVDGMVCISSAERDALAAQFPSLRHAIIFCHEATDIDFFKPSAINETAATSNRPLIVSAGNFGRNFAPLITATKTLDVDVFLATKPGLVAGLPLHDRVQTGQLSAADMRILYERAAIVYVAADVPPGSLDSVGTLVLGESMAMGKAIIAAHTRSFESYMTDGKNGLFVPQNDSVALRTAIESLLTNPQRRNELATNARRFAEEHLDQRQFAACINQLIHRL